MDVEIWTVKLGHHGQKECLLADLLVPVRKISG